MGDDSSYSPTGILSITGIPGDHMAMTVHNGLASNSSDIETDIVPAGFFCFFDNLLTVTDQFEYRSFFLTGQVKKILYMAERDHEHMSSGHRIPVPTGIAEPVLCNDHVSRWRTEETDHGRLHASNPRTSIRYAHFSLRCSIAISCQPSRGSGVPVSEIENSRSNFLGYSFRIRFQ